MQSGFRRHVIASLGGLLMVLAVVLLELNAQLRVLPGLADVVLQADAVAYDLRLRALVDRRAERRQPVVIVDIDEASLAEIGQWPWPRTRVAELLQRLAGAGAAVIALDVVFSEPELNPVQRIMEDPTVDLPAPTAELLAALAPRLDGDRRLADAVAAMDHTDVVFGVFLGRAANGIGDRPPGLPGVDPERLRRTTLMSFDGWAAPARELVGAARTGHVITVPDDLDGVIRSAPLLVRLDDAMLPSLALEAVRAYLLIDDLGLQTVPQGERLIPTRLELGPDVRIPLDEYGRVRVPYRGPAFSFPYLSAVRVLEDDLTAAERDALTDALVLIGTSSIGLADLRSTPTDRVYPGVEVHATVAEALLETAARALDDDAFPVFPNRGDLSEETTLLGLAVGGTLLALAMPLLGAVGLAITASTLVTGWLGLGAWAWLRGIDLPVITPILLVLAVTTLNLLRGFFREASGRRELRGMFDQYVPPAHIERMVALGHSLALDGESRVMTVLFADIQGFTRLSEGLSAPDLKRVLNEFFTPITRVILERQGTIDKYVGDMVMAFWNAPLVDARHREHAVDTALTMADTMHRLRDLFVARGLPPLEIGIGVNTGLMNVGDMGSDFRRAYTVIGDAVNLASRIESLTRTYGINILVGEQTRDESEGYLFRFVDRVQVKGRQATVRVYEPLGLATEVDPELEARVLRWHGAYWKFLARDWEGAAADIDRLIEAEPELRLYRVYRERIDALRHADLDATWNGETVMTDK